MGALRGVVLVGPRGAGKTTLGKALAGRLGWGFADGDELLAARVGRPAGRWLQEAGEPAFRRVEAEVSLAALGAKGPFVLALGGGAVLAAPVREALSDPGLLTVFLEAPVEQLAARIGRDPSRPPLTDLPPRAEVLALLARRRDLYEKVAGLRLLTWPEDVDACVARLLAAIHDRGA